ncbi:hypothetical protein ACK9YZ_07025 [Rhizobium sp. ZK1]|uniref:hypothetical protein n=1 Tax=Rhizobium sp. ZK1 TaxID=3389872 RepID=UPI0039F733D2
MARSPISIAALVGAGIIGPGGGGHPAPTNYQIIANATGVANVGGTVANTGIYNHSRQRHKNGKVAVRNIRFVDQLIRITTGTGVEVASPAQALNYDVALEKAASVEALLYGGVANPLLNPGTTNITDPSTATLAADEEFWSRYIRQVTAGANGFSQTGNIYNDQQGFTLTTKRTLLALGAFNASGTVASNAYSPTAILGIPDSPIASLIAVADSIGDNQADNNTAAAGGFINRATLNVDGHVFNWARQTVGGNSMNAQQSLTLLQKALWQYATDILFALATNDLASAGTTLQNLKDRFTVLANYAQSITGPYGKRLRVHASSIIPRGTFDAGQEAIRVAYNAWLAAGADGLCDKYHDTASAVVSAPSTWPSGDQIHPPPAEHANMASVLAANLVPFQDPYYMPVAA